MRSSRLGKGVLSGVYMYVRVISLILLVSLLYCVFVGKCSESGKYVDSFVIWSQNNRWLFAIIIIGLVVLQLMVTRRHHDLDYFESGGDVHHDMARLKWLGVDDPTAETHLYPTRYGLENTYGPWFSPGLPQGNVGPDYVDYYSAQCATH